MFHLESFWYREDGSSDSDEIKTIGESLLVWIQSEAEDQGTRPSVLRKMVKNVRWLANKTECKRILLHSFAHLGESKASSDFANGIIEEAADRLRERDFEVHIVPFGHFYEFGMHVKGPSLAKVFKRF
ncbi:MAG: threonyl-tRNA synthetase editing domain-containing protein [Candidatus Thorarchaeota archaeon]|jgi:hypothetical protein